MDVTSACKILGPEIGYVDMLNYETTETLKREKEAGTGKRYTPIRPSAAGKCERELFYESMLYHGKASYHVDVNEAETTRLLSLGGYIENHIIKQLETHLKMFEVRYKQQMLSFGKLEPKDKALGQWLEGSIDACFWSDKYKCVVDFKSKKDGFSSYRSTRWDETSEKLAKMACVTQISDAAFYTDNLEDFLGSLNDPFFEANFLQLNLYANSEFLKERGIDHAAIIQYNKNTSQLREVRFRPSAALAAKVVGKFENALNAASVGDEKLAKQEYMLGSMKCAFCPFSKLCWGDDKDGRKAWFSTFGAKTWPTDTHKLGEDGATIEKLVASLPPLSAAEVQREQVEKSILQLMSAHEVGKIRTEAGEIYEAKFLKTPRPHVELRRGKL